MITNILIAIIIAWLTTSIISIILSRKIDGFMPPELSAYQIALFLGPYAMVLLSKILIDKFIKEQKKKYLDRKKQKLLKKQKEVYNDSM